MKICELISVGTELLLGNIVDTNQAFLSQELADMGIAVYFRQTCGDNRARLEEAVRLALSRSDLVILTGGLGPTYDDVTKNTVAGVLGMPLREDPSIAAKLRAFFDGMGMPMTPNNLSQAFVPEGGEILENDWGTAPGLWLEKDGKTVVMMPGVPREMKPMFRERVAPRLNGGETLYSVTLHLYGIGESAVDERLSARFFTRRNPTVAPYAKEGEVEIRITARADSVERAEALCRETERELFNEVGEFIYSDCGLSLAAALTERLADRGVRLILLECGTTSRLTQAVAETPRGANVLCGSRLTPRCAGDPEILAAGTSFDLAPGEIGLALYLDADLQSGNYGSVAVAVCRESDPRSPAVFTRRFARGKKEAAFLQTLAALFAEASLLRFLGIFCEKPPVLP